jgi:hypothetical protein
MVSWLITRIAEAGGCVKALASGGEKMMSNGRILIGLKSLVSLALVLAFIFASQQVAAANRLAGIVGGKTEVTNAGTCGSGTWIIAVPAVLDVDDGDNIYVDYRFWWWDNRSAGSSPTAYHNYTLLVTYQSNTYRNNYSRWTRGNEASFSMVSVYVYGITQGYSVGIRWFANVTGPTDRTCPANTPGSTSVYLG